MAEIPILETLNTILREWRGFTKPRQRDLLRITKAQYDEMRLTHKEFDQLISRLIDLTHTVWAQREVREGDLSRLQEIADQRRAGRPDRLERYEQAQVYASKGPEGDVSVFKAIPDDLRLAVQSFMKSVIDYFSSERDYDHELGHAFRRTASLFAQSKEIIEKRPGSWEADLGQCMRMLHHHRSENEARWIRLSRDYYRTYSTFADHGIFLAGESVPGREGIQE